MKKSPTSKHKGGKNQAGSTHGLLIAAACAVALAQLILYWLGGCVPLLISALITLLPALCQIPLLLPVGKLLPKKDPEKAEQLLGYVPVIKAVLTALVIVALNVVCWLNIGKVKQETGGYYEPVLLAVLIVVCVILEKWGKHAGSGQKPFAAAICRNVTGALWLSRWVLILLTAGNVIRLMGFYDPSKILKVVLGIAFAYVTVRLLWSLLQRVVRGTLETEPELSLSPFGDRDEDTDLLTYLEQNTGITMRSLWSLRFMGKLLLPALAGVVLLLWLSTGIVTVDAHQEGALYRAGKLQQQTLKPGLHLTIPWPIDRVEIYDTQSIGTVTIGYIPEGDVDNTWTEDHGIEEYRLLLGSGDEMVSINLKVQYRIEDLCAYVSSSAKPVSLLQAKAYEIVTERTINSNLETLLSVDRKEFAESFRQELAEKLQTHNTGLQVTDVVLESIHPPVEVADVYQKIISAGIEADELVINAESVANQSILKAKQKYITEVGTATVSRHQNVAKAKAAVAEFMASVAADKTYRNEYRYYKYMTALMQTYTNANLIIVGEGVDTSNLYIGSMNVSGMIAGDPQGETN